MGLDSSIYREVSLKDNLAEIKGGKQLTDALNGTGNNFKEFIHKREVAYWRKFWAIHNYMSDHFNETDNDNCVNMYLGIKDIRELNEKLKELLSKVKVIDGFVPNGISYGTYDSDKEFVIYGTNEKVKAENLNEGDKIIHEKSPFDDPDPSIARYDEVVGKRNVADGKTSLQLQYYRSGRIVSDTKVCEELFENTDCDASYDEWYLQGVEETVSQFSEIIKEHEALLALGIDEYDIVYYYRAWY